MKSSEIKEMVTAGHFCPVSYENRWDRLVKIPVHRCWSCNREIGCQSLFSTLMVDPIDRFHAESYAHHILYCDNVKCYMMYLYFAGHKNSPYRELARRIKVPLLRPKFKDMRNAGELAAPIITARYLDFCARAKKKGVYEEVKKTEILLAWMYKNRPRGLGEWLYELPMAHHYKWEKSYDVYFCDEDDEEE